MQDKTLPTPFTKGRQSGVIKNNASCILHQAPYAFIPFVVSLLVFLLISCGKKEVKPVSEESRLSREAIKVAERLRLAYLENDRRMLENNSTKDGYIELIGAIKSFEDAELTFTPTWVEIEDSTVYLTVSWKGKWETEGRFIEERGVVTFKFEGNPLKLSKVYRANPFRQPE
jgi:hypothetical protein